MKAPLKTLVVTLSLLSATAFNHPQAQAAELSLLPGTAIVAVAALIGGSMVMTTYLVDTGAIRFKEVLDAAAPDAARFVATNGAESTALLDQLISETRKDIEKCGENPSRYSDLDIAQKILELTQTGE